MKPVGIILFIVAITLFPAISAFSSPVEDHLQNTEETLDELKASRGELLSPKNFARAAAYLQKARNALKSGKNTKDIEKQLANADAAIDAAGQVLEDARRILKESLSAREDCRAAGAEEFSAELYQKAENKFTAAVSALEAGKLDAAKKRSQEAEKLFRDAELDTIKISIIGKARKAIRDAENINAEEYAPQTLQKAEDFAQSAAKILNRDRYAGEEARREAEKATREARHAIHITSLARSMEGRKNAVELMILDLESYLRRIGDELNLELSFEDGLKEPVDEIAQTIEKVLTENRAVNLRLNESIVQKNEELEKLRTTLNDLRGRLAATEGDLALEKERRRLEDEARKREEERIKRVYALFSPDEAVVMTREDDLVIRLVGLKFPPGKSDLPPESFGLLSKVMSAVQEFPHNRIVIEGHTDSFGRDSANQVLSEERAEAVRSYLVANSSGASAVQFEAVGYGESRPVASNETARGRALNRRIEIIIKEAVKP